MYNQKQVYLLSSFQSLFRDLFKKHKSIRKFIMYYLYTECSTIDVIKAINTYRFFSIVKERSQLFAFMFISIIKPLYEIFSILQFTSLTWIQFRVFYLKSIRYFLNSSVKYVVPIFFKCPLLLRILKVLYIVLLELALYTYDLKRLH